MHFQGKGSTLLCSTALYIALTENKPFFVLIQQVVSAIHLGDSLLSSPTEKSLNILQLTIIEWLGESRNPTSASMLHRSLILGLSVMAEPHSFSCFSYTLEETYSGSQQIKTYFVFFSFFVPKTENQRFDLRSSNSSLVAKIIGLHNLILLLRSP